MQLEHTDTMPEKLQESSPSSMQSAWNRAEVIRKAKTLLATDVKEALVEIADVVFQSALHTCTTADRSLLRHIHQNMKFRASKGDRKDPVAWATWNKTLLSDETTQLLLSEQDNIRAEISSVSRIMGTRLPMMSSDRILKDKYVDFFVALLDTMVDASQQNIFMQHMAAAFGRDSVELDRNALILRLRRFLESPIPDDFIRRKRKNTTTEKHTLKRASELLFGLQSKL
jgi:hemolysin-activating ACP:hemolysin acyltransferase